MLFDERHEMTLVERRADDSEEWACPTCERRILLSCNEKIECRVLAAGDESVAHYGGALGAAISVSISVEGGGEEPSAADNVLH